MATPSFGGAGLTNVPMMGQAGNMAYEPGAMSTGHNSNPFEPYFGKVQGEFKLNPYSKFGFENWTLPQAYKGSNDYMTQLIIHVIQDEDMWPTRVVLPIRLTESEMEIQWDEIRFDRHLLGPVPEEGVSRLITQTTNERRDHYVRYGLAFLLEHGFMRTEKGRTCYKANLEQIRNAVLESMHIGVIESLLGAKAFSQAFTRRYGQSARSGSALRGILGEEVETYATVQKNEHGFDILDSRVKRYMRANGVSPDTWIVPQGMMVYLATVRPENTQYALRGPSGPSTYDSALNGAKVTAIHTANDCQIFETKSFELPNMPAAFDPLSREVTVGEYNTMHDTVFEMLPLKAEYKSHMRDIYVYNEDKDGFSRITLRQALKYSNRFLGGTGEAKGTLYWPPEFGSALNTKMNDMFLHFVNGNKVPCRFFGDMDAAYLNKGAVRNMAQTIVSRFLQKQNGNDTKTFKTLIEEAVAKVENSSEPLKTPNFVDEGVTAFSAFVKDYIPTSSVFDQENCPAWIEGDKSTGSFFTNALGRQVYPVWKETMGKDDSFPDIDDASHACLSKYPEVFKQQTSGKFDGAMAANALTESVHAALLDLIKSSSSNTSEVSLNEISVNKVLNFYVRHVAVFKGSKLLAKFFGVVTNAKQNAVSYENDFLFALHKVFDSVSQLSGPHAFKALITAFEEWSSTAEFKTDVMNPKMEVVVDAWKSKLGSAVGGGTRDDPKDTIIVGGYTLQKGYVFHTPGTQDLALGASSSKEKYYVGFDPQNPGHTISYAHFGAMEHTAFTGGHKHFQPSGGSKRHDDNDDDEDAHMAKRSKGGRFGAKTHFAPQPGGFKIYNSADEAAKDNTSSNMQTNWEDVDGEDVLVRAVMKTFLHTPINEAALLKLVDKDAPIPFSFMIFRPAITHNMSTAILCKAGSSTGETLIGHCDFQLGDDVQRKMHYGNLTLYSKSIVYKSDSVHLAENVFATGYVRGNDVSFNTLQSLAAEHEPRRSIYCCLVPAPRGAGEDDGIVIGNVPEDMNPMDVTGGFAASVPHLAQLELELGNSTGRAHYATANFYSLIYQWNNSAAVHTQQFEYEQLNRYNTLVFQGHQSSYNPHSGLYDLTTVNTGHWGANVYPGAGKVRRGLMKTLMNVSYNTAFGATQNVVSIVA